MYSLYFFFFSFFFFNDTATTEIYTLSLHDALPITRSRARPGWCRCGGRCALSRDRKSTRLNSSHMSNSYAVFCLKKKKKTKKNKTTKRRKKQNTKQERKTKNKTI